MHKLHYLEGYSPHVISRVQALLDTEQLSAAILGKYPAVHGITSAQALYEYTLALKNDYLRMSAPLSRVVYDDKIRIRSNALGLHSFTSRVQGHKLKAKNEIRIASVFKRGPVEFLKTIVVHELAHLREKDHNRAFYNLCEHMEPAYHQLEFDVRLYLTHIELLGPLY
jgi:predicted metal-dependent hydrolase